MTAQRYAVQLEAQLEGLRAMKLFQIGRDGLEGLYKAVSERAVDWIIGDRLSYPSVFHDRIDLAQARMYALSPTAGEPPSLSLALEVLQVAGVDEQDILDVMAILEAQDGRSLVTDGQLTMHLKSLGYPVTCENLARARPTAVAAMARACLSALSGTSVVPLDILGVPTPPAMALFDQPMSNFQEPAVASTANLVCLAEPVAQSSGVIQGSFSEVAEVVIKRRLAEGLWDDDRAREVRASVNLFIGASWRTVNARSPSTRN